MDADKRKTFIFIIILCFISSSLLAITSKALHSRKKLNEAIELKKHILKVLNFNIHNTDTQTISKLYTKNIRQTQINQNTFYNSLNKDHPGIAILLKGKGLWGKIEGIVALEDDFNTIKNISFYTHHETPGLGSEIESNKFQHQFIGKKIYNKNGKLISINLNNHDKKALKTPEEHLIDGISGATYTSKAVTRILKRTFLKYDNFLNKSKTDNDNLP